MLSCRETGRRSWFATSSATRRLFLGPLHCIVRDALQMSSWHLETVEVRVSRTWSRVAGQDSLVEIGNEPTYELYAVDTYLVFYVNKDVKGWS